MKKLITLLLVLGLANAASAGFYWDGSGSVPAALVEDIDGGDSWRTDYRVTAGGPEVGWVTHDQDAAKVKVLTHNNATMDDSVGWYVETSLEPNDANNVDDGFGLSIWGRNNSGTWGVTFLTHIDSINVWQGGGALTTLGAGVTGWNGIGDWPVKIRVQVAPGASEFEVLVDDSSVGTYPWIPANGTTEGGPAYIHFGDSSANGQGYSQAAWDYMENDVYVPGPASVVFTWATAGTGEWDSKSNWSSPSNGAPPDNDNETAIFGDSIGRRP